MTARTPIIRAAGEGDQRAFMGGGLHTWKLRTEDTEGAFFLFEDHMARGKSTPLHQHPEADETVYVLEGEILLNVHGVEHHICAGGLTFTPRGTPHAFVVVSDVARLITIQAPGVGQAFYRDASEATTAATSEVVDLPRLQASASEHPDGIQILGPPPFAHLRAG